MRRANRCSTTRPLGKVSPSQWRSSQEPRAIRADARGRHRPAAHPSRRSRDRSSRAFPDAMRLDVPLDTRAHPGRPPREHPSQDLPWPAAGWAPTSADIDGGLPRRSSSRRATSSSRRSRRHDVSPRSRRASDRSSTTQTRRRSPRRRSLPSAGARASRSDRSMACPGPSRSRPRCVVCHARRDRVPRPRRANARRHDVARVRAAGAITLGTTPMTEFGMTPNGANAKRVMPRNPHAVDRLAGGSSTGSGVAVATGLVPFALGADGGGSIRIPSAHQRSVRDQADVGTREPRGRHLRRHRRARRAARVLDGQSRLCARGAQRSRRRRSADASRRRRERGSFVAALGRGVRGMVIGVPEGEWADASDPVQRAGRAALAALEKRGRKARPAPARSRQARGRDRHRHHRVRGARGLREEWREHRRRHERRPPGELRRARCVHRRRVPRDVPAPHRAAARDGARVREVDLVAMPSTVAAAAKVSDTDMRTGFLDTKIIDGLCRFMFMGNLTGLPAASVPVGATRRASPSACSSSAMLGTRRRSSPPPPTSNASASRCRGARA